MGLCAKNNKRFSRYMVACLWIVISLISVLSEGAMADRSSVIMPLAEKSLLLDIAYAGPGRIVAVGERGHVLLSDDHGDAWRQVAVPTESTLTTVFFLDKKMGWAAGHDAVILVTKDGGASWQKQYDDPAREQPIMDICFRDSDFGVAVGAYGLYLETHDGGKTWEDKYFESLDDPDFGLAHFYALAFVDNETLFMAGEAGFLARSLDAGNTWEPLEKIYIGSYFGALVTGKGSLIVCGLRGNAFRSTDTGDSWSPISTGTTATFNSCIQGRSGKIILAGLGSTLLISDDDGGHFTRIQRQDRISIASAVVIDDNTLVIAGEGGVRKIGY